MTKLHFSLPFGPRHLLHKTVKILTFQTVLTRSPWWEWEINPGNSLFSTKPHPVGHRKYPLFDTLVNSPVPRSRFGNDGAITGPKSGYFTDSGLRKSIIFMRGGTVSPDPYHGGVPVHAPPCPYPLPRVPHHWHPPSDTGYTGPATASGSGSPRFFGV